MKDFRNVYEFRDVIDRVGLEVTRLEQEHIERLSKDKSYASKADILEKISAYKRDDQPTHPTRDLTVKVLLIVEKLVNEGFRLKSLNHAFKDKSYLTAKNALYDFYAYSDGSFESVISCFDKAGWLEKENQTSVEE